MTEISQILSRQIGSDEEQASASRGRGIKDRARFAIREAGSGKLEAYFVTVTVSVVLFSLPRLFDDQQLTVVLPTGNIPPDAGVQNAGRSPSSLSRPDAVNLADGALGGSGRRR